MKQAKVNLKKKKKKFQQAEQNYDWHKHFIH